MIVGAGVAAGDSVQFREMSIEGLPPESRVVAYAVADIGDRDLLAIEVIDSDGVTVLYLLDHLGGELHARVAGPSMIPGGLQSIEAIRRVRREIPDGPPETRFWSIVDERPGRNAGIGCVSKSEARDDITSPSRHRDNA